MQFESVELGQESMGSAFFRMKVPSFSRNAFDVCHGGALTTYVDITTTCAIYSFDELNRAQVSAKLDMDFIAAANIDEEVIIEAKVNKMGKMLAFSEARIYGAESK
jgi:uncharacterized protein (TIGR00369 family)